MDAEILARVQFAVTISFHILFPSFSIGLAAFLALMEGAWLKTKNPLYLSICRFWMKIFALTFGMGVISGIVMEFQLGTNWSGMTKAVGPVLGSLFTWEVLTAFFIEAGFLGVMLFGWNRVSRKLHYVATLLVFVGVTVSGFWILSANSWMQTPAGAVWQGGHFVVTSWLDVIFNPSTVTRYIHMLLAAYLTTVLVVAAVSAYYLLKKTHIRFARACLKFCSLILVILAMAQVLVGDETGLVDYRYQPIKTAAMEANWQTRKGAPMVLFAMPSVSKQKNLFEVGIPHLASLINTHDWNGELIGLDSVPAKDRPFVPIVFYSFRVMVGLGILIMLLGVWALILRLRHRLYRSRWFLRTCQLAGPLGFVALLAGWFTAETGRQPWVVYNVLRTSDTVSPISWQNVMISLGLIVVVYGIIFGYCYCRYLRKIIHHGPEDFGFRQLNNGGAE